MTVNTLVRVGNNGLLMWLFSHYVHESDIVTTGSKAVTGCWTAQNIRTCTHTYTRTHTRARTHTRTHTHTSTLYPPANDSADRGEEVVKRHGLLFHHDRHGRQVVCEPGLRYSCKCGGWAWITHSTCMQPPFIPQRCDLGAGKNDC